MAEINTEKPMDTKVHEREDSSLDKHQVVETKLVIGDDNFQQAMIKEPPKPFNLIAIRLYLICIVGFFCSTSNGFDSSLFGALLANDTFTEYFDVRNVGIGAGIVTSMAQIGGVTSVPFVGPMIDTWGRRVGMMLGGAIIIIGVIIQGTVINTREIGQFMAFGVNLISAAGPCYTVEISHPAYRGVVVGLYNCFWPVGALIASGTNRGCINLPGNVSWLVPIWLQMLFPGLVFILAPFIPESPRWNYCNGKMEAAKAFLTKYHGNGNSDSEWVKLQMFEYESHLELEGADKRWWDYRALFKNRASFYRLGTNCITALFGQWAGNGVVSYFLSGVLDTAGIEDGTRQSDLFVVMNAVQIIFAVIGSCFVDKIGRRPLLIWVNFGCGICWIGVTAAAGIQNRNGDAASSGAMVGMIYLFQAVYSFGWTPLQALYPVEVLSYEMRAKGMAFSGLFVSAGTLVNQFGFPVALEQIQWRTYFVFLVWCFIQSALFFFFAPETKNRTLEELDDIFNSPNPRNASIEKKKLELDQHANVVGVTVLGKDTSTA